MATVLRMKAAQGVFIVRNVLNFVDEQVVVASLRQVGRGISVQVVCGDDVLEGMKLLVDVHHVGCTSVGLQPGLQQLEHITFADPALADKDDYHPSVQMGNDMVEVGRTVDYFHKQTNLVQRYKIYLIKTVGIVENVRYTLIKTTSMGGL